MLIFKILLSHNQTQAYTNTNTNIENTSNSLISRQLQELTNLIVDREH